MEKTNETSNQQDEGDKKPRAALEAAASAPEWRSMALMGPATADVGFGVSGSAMGLARPTSLAGPTRKNEDVIDKESYFSAAVGKSDRSIPDDSKSNWAPTKLRPVPAFYPLERSSRFVEDDLVQVVTRVSECNRVLSVQAVYCNETATATLLTAENVEMHLSLWKVGGPKQPDGIAVELQRRKGDSIAFHRYSKHILDAAVGDFNPEEYVQIHGEDVDIVYSKKVHRLLNLETVKDSASEIENAIIAIEIAHGLLMKDRMDARQLGLESLCLLTDPNKTGNTTALIASRVVLLGTAQDLESEQEELICDEGPFQEIRQTILSLIQFRRIGEADEFDGPSALTEEEEHITILHNLALAVLANALDVIENEERREDEPEETRPAVRGRLDSASSICDSFLDEACEVSGDQEILKTLISELGKAGDKPHNACLSAKCIGSLCRASDKARRRAKELGAKTVVQTALDVGTRTHLKLEKECTKVMTTLNTNTEN